MTAPVAPALVAAAAAAAPELRLLGPWARLGGLVNVVHRVPAEPVGSVIVKHAPPHVASAPAVPLRPERIALEHAALRALAPGGVLADVLGPRVRAPRALGFDRETALLVLEDLGERQDLAATVQAEPARAPELLRLLGEAMARLHARSAGRAELAAAFANTDVQWTREQTQYETVREWLEGAGHPAADLLGARAAALGRTLLAPGRCLVMGDLWPASVLPADDGCFLIDWEFVHYGRPLQDVAHLAAHLWMHAHRARTSAGAHAFGQGLAAFLDGYAAGIAPAAQLFDPEELRDGGIHAGCELLARTLGPFAGGFLYDGLGPSHPAVEEAVATAVRQLASDDGGDLLAPLRGALRRPTRGAA